MPVFKPETASEVVLSFDHGSTNADVEWKLYKVPTARKLRVRSAEVVNPTGLAANADDYFDLKLKNGSTVIASKSTAAAALAADTFTALTLSSTDDDLVLDEGEVLSFQADETGDQTLPAGRLVVHAWLI